MNLILCVYDSLLCYLVNQSMLYNYLMEFFYIIYEDKMFDLNNASI